MRRNETYWRGDAIIAPDKDSNSDQLHPVPGVVATDQESPVASFFSII